MSAECKYGDVEKVENVELVECRYNEQSGGISYPKKRVMVNRSRDKLSIRLEMNVHFVGEDGKSTKRTFLAEYDKSENSDELLVDKSAESSPPSSPPPPQLTATTSCRNGCKPFSIKRLFALSLANLTGEFIGTFFLTLFICTIVTSAVVTGAQSGLWQVAIVCGVGVSLSIYCTAHFSDAHLNPAVTVAFALVRWKTFSYKRIIPYVMAQMLGGFCAGGVTFGIYQHTIQQFELEHDIVRGSNNSAITAMLFGEYFPNPALFDHSNPDNLAVVSTTEALLIEAWTTCILAFIIFCFTDKDNTVVGSGNDKVVVPVLIGITVASMISLYGSLTQVGMNPARDFGPRIFAAIAGWGVVAIPGPRYGFWVYILGPVIGAVAGAAFYDFVVSNILKFARAAKNKPVVIEH